MKRRLHLPYMLIILGSLLLGLWGFHRYLYNRSLSLSSALLASYSQEKKYAAVPIHIAIGSRISLPVVEAGRVKGEWTISQTSANHVHESANPGDPGNIIIYGHNTNKIFGYLLDAKVGDTIKIRLTDGEQHIYVVESTQYVSPGQTALLAPTETETLTLYTCAGLFDSLRFVVRAKPADNK